MTRNYSGIDPAYCKKAAEYLSHSFSFSSSPEGGSFWFAIHTRLTTLGRGMNATKPCWQEEDDDSRPEYTIKLLRAAIENMEEEIDSQAKEIVALRSKLLTADFCNMLGSRSGGF